MTNLVVTRHLDGKAHKMVVPTQTATDTEYAAFTVQTLREYLYRAGINATHIPDAQMLMQLRHTFQDTRSGIARAPGGEVAANPVQSG